VKGKEKPPIPERKAAVWYSRGLAIRSLLLAKAKALANLKDHSDRSFEFQKLQWLVDRPLARSTNCKMPCLVWRRYAGFLPVDEGAEQLPVDAIESHHL
jgi:hypothetical protein